MYTYVRNVISRPPYCTWIISLLFLLRAHRDKHVVFWRWSLYTSPSKRRVRCLLLIFKLNLHTCIPERESRTRGLCPSVISRHISGCDVRDASNLNTRIVNTTYVRRLQCATVSPSEAGGDPQRSAKETLPRGVGRSHADVSSAVCNRHKSPSHQVDVFLAKRFVALMVFNFFFFFW